MASARSYFISCDWGTSNLRLRVVAVPSLREMARYDSPQGVKSLNAAFRASGTNDREGFFIDRLRAQLTNLPEAHRGHDVVASGMLSSSIGLRELPYADLPLDHVGSGLIARWQSIGIAQRLLLVSGVATPTDIMRGEETQAVGALAGWNGGSGVLILPGTHSKHLRVEGGRVTDFTTFLTGELFELLTTHSILATSVEYDGRIATGSQRTAFREGLKAGVDGNLSQQLFGVRVRQLLLHTEPAANYAYLSGLLIGDEIGTLPPRADRLHLAAAGDLEAVYRGALSFLYPTIPLTCYDQDALLLSGQYTILQAHDT